MPFLTVDWQHLCASVLIMLLLMALFRSTFGNLLTLSSFNITGTTLVVLFQVIDHVYNRDAQTYSSILDQQLMPGEQYELYMKFVGLINDHMQGFYRSSYVDPETGQKRYECKCHEVWT